jgi:hypothetical protein
MSKFANGTLYHSKEQATAGYAVIVDSDQYYLEYIQFGRLKDAVALRNGQEPEKRGKRLSIAKPSFLQKYELGSRVGCVSGACRHVFKKYD